MSPRVDEALAGEEEGGVHRPAHPVQPVDQPAAGGAVEEEVGFVERDNLVPGPVRGHERIANAASSFNVATDSISLWS